jgi:alpha-glucoside transport system substrate-binding protein
MNYLGGFASGFITDQFPEAVPEEDFDFFPFPGGAVTGGANIVYAFNDDDATCSFLEHLASAEAQQIWVGLGGFTSVNTGVSLDAYPDPIARAQAEQLTQAEVFRFDLDDAIGGGLQTAFFTGVTDYLADPDSLDAILEGIEAARE